MKTNFYTCSFTILLSLFFSVYLNGQSLIKGIVLEENTREPLIGATIMIKDSNDGTASDENGQFELNTDQSFPLILQVRHIGHLSQELELSVASNNIVLTLREDIALLDSISIIGERRPEAQKTSALTIESMDIFDIEETASSDFYQGLGAKKDIDMMTPSIGFKVINTRGFNSTSPVRSLQLIDGVDNQAPGLSFSLGNFLGASELDVLKVDLIVGASSPFYGPNAFNGVVNMETKNPFIQKGLSAIIKTGERNLKEAAIRYADVIRNKDSLDVFAFKFNCAYLQADDWVADNYAPVYDTRTREANPGRWDAVNIYGDEFYPLNDGGDITSWSHPGMGVFHRIGYQEKDLVDYNTRNYKANLALHFRTNPSLEYESPELIFSSSFGSGTTVYQGDNRFSLKNILFFQNRLEIRKKGKWFVRAYATNEDAGDSYDPYFTALQLQDRAKTNKAWGFDYREYWKNNIVPQMELQGYPEFIWNDELLRLEQDTAAALAWIAANQESLSEWHKLTANHVNIENAPSDFLIPGTDRFNAAFKEITSTKSNDKEKGTLFYDKSALYHLHGETVFETKKIDHITLGGNGRLYRPDTDGTIFSDTAGNKITNWEVGAYLGLEKKFFEETLISNFTIRIDKNENFNLVATPAASLVWVPNPNNYIRLSFSSAIRNPTLSDQYLNLNVGRATLVGNLDGVDGLISVESFDTFRDCLCPESLQFFSLASVQPEKVKTFEIGYRTTIYENIYLDAGYYFNHYDDFLGYQIGIKSEFNDLGFPILSTLKTFRYAANSLNKVKTQGFSIGINFDFWKFFKINGNYSWNKLNTKTDDSIIPAFNTPEHKYNLSISGRDFPINFGNKKIKGLGFNINYKWIEGFLFEGSPQFTGFIPSYDLLDAQINFKVQKINSTIKAGVSNLLNKQRFQTYGGPRIGRLAYLSIRYNFQKM